MTVIYDEFVFIMSSSFVISRRNCHFFADDVQICALIFFRMTFYRNLFHFCMKFVSMHRKFEYSIIQIFQMARFDLFEIEYEVFSEIKFSYAFEHIKYHQSI